MHSQKEQNLKPILMGNMRNIDRIEFWYDTKDAANRKAEVEVWGRQ